MSTSKIPSASIPKRPELDTEVATRQSDPWQGGFMGSASIIYTNDPLLLERAGAGSQAHELYRDLKRDGKVFAALQKRKLAVIGRPWTVKPLVDTPQGKRDAAIVADILQGFAFDRLCAALLDALLVGWQPAEVVWTLRDIRTPDGGTRQMIVPGSVPRRQHRRFVWRDTQPGQPPELRLLTRSAMQEGVPVPARKFIIHAIEGEDANPYGTGLGLQLFWPVFFKRRGVLSWNKFCERFGSPTPWGKYPREATAREKGTLFEALRAFSSDGFVMTPEGTMIELLESRLASGTGTPNQSMVEYMDDWIAEVIIGQPPRNGSGGALAAAANEREDVRLELSQGDSDLLSETLNSTLLQWICDYNGLQPCVVHRKITKETDRRLEAETDARIVQMGFAPSLEYIHEKYGEGWQPAQTSQASQTSAPPHTPLQGTPPTPATPATPPNFAQQGSVHPDATPHPHPLDALDVLALEAASEWQELFDPMIAPIAELLQQAAARGDTAADVLAALPDVLHQMDDSRLHQRLTQAALVADTAAQTGVRT